ncbi:hypothetical protein [Candidatus Manganitrophus noduliformans]|uniref:Uncharacterized protein n=1 Tax=Candidatus Manganitrophus noduliformans TaxID=2606439 RepID=A0A7X6DSW5_9BACT|nr:hypothetical protein [Candidatus Manganitrophus noduliformans]NKE72652.1 hypothetical protein [Candidatus Manganitrophus noduliformans]
METMTWFLSEMAPWIGILPLALFSFIPAIYLLSSARPQVKRVQVVCPQSGKRIKVRLKINLFRNPNKTGKGLDIVSCSNYSGAAVDCAKECLFDARAQQAFRRAGRRHAAKNSIIVLP